MKDYKPLNCFNLFGAAIETYFCPISEINRTWEEIDDVKRERIEDSSGMGIDIFCDCTSSFESGKLRKFIANYNKIKQYDNK